MPTSAVFFKNIAKVQETYLDLREYNFAINELRCLIDALNENDKVKKLDLTYNGLDSDKAKELARLKKAVELYLDHNQIGDSALDVLREMRKRGFKIHLGNDNNFSREKLAAFEQEEQKKPGLR